MIIQADSSAIFPLADESVQCVVTSPPYWGLRDYGIDGQIGREATPQEYVAKMVAVFREVWRVLKPDGVCWLNIGDSWASTPTGTNCQAASTLQGGKTTQVQSMHRPNKVVAGLKAKDLIGIPWRLAFALQADGMADRRACAVLEDVMAELVAEYEGSGCAIPDRVMWALDRLRGEYEQAKGDSWYLRQDVIWSKPNPMPESVRDRCTSSHEYIFLLTKSARYYYDAEAIKTEAQPRLDSRPFGNAGGSRNGDEGRVYRQDKQRGHSRRHDGFNDRWGLMSKDEQQSMGANCRSVWWIATKPYSGAHFATFPPELPERCILAGSREGDVVLDPFGGSGTTVEVAERLNRRGVALELNAEYCGLARERTWQNSRQMRIA